MTILELEILDLQPLVGFYYFVFIQLMETIPLVSKITLLGPQQNPDAPRLSRDGGVSVLLNNRIVWIYDDTALTSVDGELLGFVSNSAAYSESPNLNPSILHNLHIVTIGTGVNPHAQYQLGDQQSILNADWIPFTPTEARFNQKDPGQERLAIWPGTNPVPLSSAEAILYAPVVLVQNATKANPETYTCQGITLIHIKMTSLGPVASRLVPNLFSRNDIPYGGFAAIVGKPSSSWASRATADHEIYLFGARSTGLEVARVSGKHIEDHAEHDYFKPALCSFHKTSEVGSPDDQQSVYLNGSFSSGSVFYSPWFKTFLLIYFTADADSTFNFRHLDLTKPSCPDAEWTAGGRQGEGVTSDDVEAVVRYAWSQPQVLYASPPGTRGYNYAGIAHPEFFTRSYYAEWMYRNGVIDSKMGWYGESVVQEEEAGGDGKYLMLSWSSQDQDTLGTGICRIMMAVVEFTNHGL